jgi:hypothetical protein
MKKLKATKILQRFYHIVVKPRILSRAERWNTVSPIPCKLPLPSFRTFDLTGSYEEKLIIYNEDLSATNTIPYQEAVDLYNEYKAKARECYKHEMCYKKRSDYGYPYTQYPCRKCDEDHKAFKGRYEDWFDYVEENTLRVPDKCPFGRYQQWRGGRGECLCMSSTGISSFRSSPKYTRFRECVDKCRELCDKAIEMNDDVKLEYSNLHRRLREISSSSENRLGGSWRLSCDYILAMTDIALDSDAEKLSNIILTKGLLEDIAYVKDYLNNQLLRDDYSRIKWNYDICLKPSEFTLIEDMIHIFTEVYNVFRP